MRAHGADRAPHAHGRTLLDHLIGTRRIVEAWGQPRELCDAALFHSAYGTDVYPIVSLAPQRRAAVRALVGERAERLAWLFSVLDRRAFRTHLQERGELHAYAAERRDAPGTVAIDASDAFALLVLHMANECDQMPAEPHAAARVRDMLAAMHHLLDERYGTLPVGFAAESAPSGT